MENLLAIRRKIFLCSGHDATLFLFCSFYNQLVIIDLKGDYMQTDTKAPIDKEWVSLMLIAKNMNLTTEEIRAFIRQTANKTKQKKE